MVKSRGFSLSTIYFCDLETYTHDSWYYKQYKDTTAYLNCVVKSGIKFDKPTHKWVVDQDVTFKQHFFNQNGCIQDYLNFFLSKWNIKKHSLGYHQIHFYHNGGGFDFNFIIKYLINKANNNEVKFVPFEPDKDQIDTKLWYVMVLYSKQYREFSIIRYVNDGINKYGKQDFRKITIEFRDSYKFLSTSIKQIGKDLGLNKQDYNKSNDLVNQSFNDNWASGEYDSNFNEMLEYCFRDCEIARRGMEVFIAPFLTSSSVLPKTTPALAIATLLNTVADEHGFKRSRNSKTKEFFMRTVMEFDSWEAVWAHNQKLTELNVYKGGLTSINSRYWNEIVNNVYVEDVVSQYPHKMTYLMPVGEGSLCTNEKEYNRYLKTGNVLMIASFTYYEVVQSRKVPDMLKTRRDSSNNIYFQYTDRAREIDIVECSDYFKPFEKMVTYKRKQFNWAMCYFRSKQIFKGFVNKFITNKIKAKQSGNKAEENFAKICLNSSYGKFGEKSLVENMVPKNVFEILVDKAQESNKDIFRLFNDDDDVIDESNFLRNKQEFEGWVEYASTRKTEQTYLQIASWITSQARTYLLNRWVEIINLGGTVLYSDTDSNFFILPEKQLTNLSFGNNLGDWDLVEPLKEVYKELSHLNERDQQDYVNSLKMNNNIKCYPNLVILGAKKYVCFDNSGNIMKLASAGVRKELVMIKGLNHLLANQPYIDLDKQNVASGLIIVDKQKNIISEHIFTNMLVFYNKKIISY